MQEHGGFILPMKWPSIPGLTGPPTDRFRCAGSFRMLVGLLLAAMLLPLAAHAQNAPPDPVRLAQAPNATVGLIAGGAGSTDARIAADIAAVLDDADRLRVLPIQGRGSIQNIADLSYLKGVDVAIVHADALALTMQRNAIAREASVQYIAKLFQEEIHVLARKSIASLGDLKGQPVEIGRAGSGNELTAGALLDALRIKASVQSNTATAALD